MRISLLVLFIIFSYQPANAFLSLWKSKPKKEEVYSSGVGGAACYDEIDIYLDDRKLIQYDLDGDKHWSFQEMKFAIIESFLKSDKNHNGELDLDEFEQAFYRYEEFSELCQEDDILEYYVQQRDRRYAAMDRNGDGFIESYEFSLEGEKIFYKFDVNTNKILDEF